MSENRVAKFIQKFVKINQINYELRISVKFILLCRHCERSEAIQ